MQIIYRLLAFLRDYFFKLFGFIIPAVLIVLLYNYLGYDKFLELSKILVWPLIAILGMLFFRKVITYLFFSLEEFNFFGTRGNLKDIRSLIEEKVQNKFQAEKDEQARLKENADLKIQLNQTHGDATRLYELGNKLVKQVGDQNLIIQERNNRIEELIQLNANLAKKSSIISASKATPRVGQLINNKGTVQYVGDGVLLGIPDLATFNSWQFSFSELLPSNSAEQTLPMGGVIPMKKAGFSNPLEQISATGIPSPSPAPKEAL